MGQTPLSRGCDGVKLNEKYVAFAKNILYLCEVSYFNTKNYE